MPVMPGRFGAHPCSKVKWIDIIDVMPEQYHPLNVDSNDRRLRALIADENSGYLAVASVRPGTRNVPNRTGQGDMK
jgi:hypothetical protein